MPELLDGSSSESKDSQINGQTLHNGEDSSTQASEMQPTVEVDDSGKDGELNDEKKPASAEEVSYTVKIMSPGSDPFELQVSSLELVHEIHQVLMDREETCHRTCFSLQLNGQTLDNFAELKSIEGLKDGIELKVVEEPYSVREARNHIKHVHDLLRSVELTDAYLGREQVSLSFVNAITGGSLLEKRGYRLKPDASEVQPPDYLLPGRSSSLTGGILPLSPLHPLQKDGKPPQCLRTLTYSNWNPPPSHRRLHGDLIYIYVHLLEDKRLHVAACPRGFYLNQSTDEEFNPRPAQHPYLSHSLIDLLRQVSPGFKRGFDALLKRRSGKHPFERVPGPYQIYSWLSPVLEHGVDSVRKEEAFCSKMVYEENLPGQTRDWNEELQATRELPQERLSERILRDRAIFKTNSDFVAAASRAAISVVNGNIMAINPGEIRKQQMFIWNNMFFSLGFDVKEHYKEFGGDHAAYAATSSDLNGVRAYATLDQPGLHTLGTAIVDYRGFRVTAQTIIPGILEKEQEQSVIYGSFDFGKTVVTNEKYTELLSKTAKHLRIRPHKVLSSNGEERELYSSVECKGIIGNDRRSYILDLLRTFPPDVNYLGPSGGSDVCQAELSPAMTKMGYPYSHRHSIVSLRQELVEAFIESRYLTFLRFAAAHMQQQDISENKPETETPAESSQEPAAADGAASQTAPPDSASCDHIEDKKLAEAKKIVEKVLESDNAVESLTRETIRHAALAVKSLSETQFELSFNPDVYQANVRFPESQSGEVERDKELVREACEFLVRGQIPAFVQDCVNQNVIPQDGRTLVELLHQRGINVRYLNRVIELVAHYPTLSYLHGMLVLELVNRCAKHLYKTYMQDVDPMSLSAAVAHFLNCFLSSCPSPYIQPSVEEVMKMSKSKKNKKNKWKSSRDTNEGMSWTAMTPATLWAKIVTEAQEYYHFKIEVEDVDSFCEKYTGQRITLLRAICTTIGIQLALRDYSFDLKNRQTFNDEDVMNLFPIVKHLHPQATDAYHFFTSGQTRIANGQLQEGHELISEALNLLNSVYGPLHPDIAACNRLLARLSYVMGEHQAALLFQHRAAVVTERVHGVDSPMTAAEYTHLALYCFACGQVSNALQLMYHARYLALLCHGESHPEMPTIDTNIGLMLHAAEEYEKSLIFLESALTLNKQFYGQRSLKVALSQHLLARAQSCRGDFRSALQFEKECYLIYKEKLGEENERTRDSSDCLRHLTQQAVTLAKRMNELSRSEGTSGPLPICASAPVGSVGAGPIVTSAAAASMLPPPIHIQAPSLLNLLETLNLVNGIYFIQLSGEDLERFRSSLVKKAIINGAGPGKSMEEAAIDVD